ncbi:MAG: PorP/SprF family type IX secretion system membrane protein [Bacteroidales bacterium]|nr:PorP/SprF family type IX secretion system membrane protein [Bacteroidales bacterium]MBK9356836.1 PorP/SprF family type IX secretion system membrane protein [Bacteroidales bacterium]
MKNIRIYLLITLAALLSEFAKAQDPLFSQFYNNPVYYNPGAVGLTPGLRARFTVRDQWPQLPADLRNYTFSMDIAERNIPGSGGLGLMVMSDNAGSGYMKTSTVGISTAVRVPLQDNMVTQVGIMTSFVQKRINWDNLVFTDQLNPVYGNIYETSFQEPGSGNIFYPDFSVGGVFRFTESSNMFSAIQGTFGLAVHHLFRPNESFIGLTSPLPRKLAITGDLVFEMNGDNDKLYFQRQDKGAARNTFKFNPGFIYESQADFKTYAVGVNILKSSIYSGVWFRNRTSELAKSNDLIFMLGINAPFTSLTRMKINYTYDFVLTEIRTATGCSHEISITIELDDFNMFQRSGNRGGGFGFSTRNHRSMEELQCCPF